MAGLGLENTPKKILVAPALLNIPPRPRSQTSISGSASKLTTTEANTTSDEDISSQVIQETSATEPFQDASIDNHVRGEEGHGQAEKKPLISHHWREDANKEVKFRNAHVCPVRNSSRD